MSLDLNTIQVSKMLNSQLPDLAHVPDLDAKEIIRQHQTVFHGIGKLKDKQITLSIDKEVKPIAQKTRRIPFLVRDKVELDLQQLEKTRHYRESIRYGTYRLGFTNSRGTEKDGRIRVCVDMRAANTAIKRISHPISTVKDISMELNCAKFFLKLDMSQAYHQLDRTLRALNAALKTGFWNVDPLKPYKSIKDEITFDHINHVFIGGTRLILPDSLQDQVITLAHQGHQGHSKTTALVREYVWFPNLDKKVKSEIEGCLACQSLAQPNPPEPLLSTPMSNQPWEHVKVDFYGPFPSGHWSSHSSRYRLLLQIPRNRNSHIYICIESDS